MMTGLRDNGMMMGGPSVFGKKECHDFVNQLNSFLTKCLTSDSVQRWQR